LVVFRERWKVEELLWCTAWSGRVARCANGVNCPANGGFGEKGVEIAKIFLELAKLPNIGAWGSVVDGESELGFLLLQLGLEDLPRSGNGVALVVEEALDAQSHFHIATAIETLSGAALMRFELRKLALPETQDIGGNVAEPGDFADAEVELVRDVGPGWWGSFADWLMLCHARNSDITAPAAVAYGPA
jgi:hypothetical protein